MKFHRIKIIFYLFAILLLQTNSLFASQNPRQHQHFDYIIDTDIGGDIDDTIALIVAIKSENKPIAVTTSHIDPVEKAKIAKLILSLHGYANIPVYAGIGVTRQDSTKKFLKLYPLWPVNYGFPNPSPNQKKWYAKQGIAYKERYSALFDKMKIENESAPAFIARIAKNYSPQSPLTIIALGPLHNIDQALLLDNTIKKNLIIYSMGGIYPKGYNWLISPETSARVLSQVKTICITSELIEKYNLNISPNKFAAIEKKIHSRIGKAIIADWKNWHEVVPGNTQLWDPVTVYLALHPEQITLSKSTSVDFPCINSSGKLKPEFNDAWYSMPGLQDQLVILKNNQKNPIKFVENVSSSNTIKNSIIQALIK
jgi:inosine-uridine nucleoside N-ribohydrolase